MGLPLLDCRTQAGPAGHRAAIDGDDPVAWFDPRERRRPGGRQSLPHLTVYPGHLTVPFQLDRDGAAGKRPDHITEVFKIDDVDASHGEDPISLTDPHLLGGRSRYHLPNRPDVGVGASDRREDDHQQDDCHNELGGRTGECDGEPGRV